MISIISSIIIVVVFIIMTTHAMIECIVITACITLLVLICALSPELTAFVYTILYQY